MSNHNLMENLLSFLILMAVIVICILILNIENPFLGILASLVFFILFIAGVIYAVGYALGETLKYRNEVEMEELVENEEND